MSTRDEIQSAINDFEQSVRARTEIAASDEHWAGLARDAVADARARLLALLGPPAPAAAPSEREIEAGARFIDGVQFSDQAWEAMPVGYKNTMRHRAKAVLLAARAARQTGGTEK